MGPVPSKKGKLKTTAIASASKPESKMEEKTNTKVATSDAQIVDTTSLSTPKEAFNARKLWKKAYQWVIKKNVSKHLIRGNTNDTKAVQADFILADFDKFKKTLTKMYEGCKANTEGKVADYIPELSHYSPDNWGVSVCTIDGQRFSIGNVSTPFPIQSCCKPLNYALSLTEKLPSDVHRYVGMEPSGRLFNDLSFDPDKKPFNPMINAGAIMVTSLLQSKIKDQEERLQKIMAEYSRLAGGGHVGFNKECFVSEKRTAYRNYALGNLMRENDAFPKDTNFEETMDMYFKLCSVEVTAESGAVIAGTLANGGFCPTTQEKVLKVGSVRDTLSLMFSCGMYDYSGQFAFRVGLPAKSGVSGVVLLVIPNVMGICMWSPPLDECGNSVRGLEFCRAMNRQYRFHHFDTLLHGSIKEDPCLRCSFRESHHVMMLLKSAAEGNLATVKKLYEAELDMSMCNSDKRTALHLASAEGHLDVVKFLLETCRVEATPKDRWNHIPRDDAVLSGHKDLIAYLNSNPGK